MQSVGEAVKAMVNIVGARNHLDNVKASLQHLEQHAAQCRMWLETPSAEAPPAPPNGPDLLEQAETLRSKVSQAEQVLPSPGRSTRGAGTAAPAMQATAQSLARAVEQLVPLQATPDPRRRPPMPARPPAAVGAAQAPRANTAQASPSRRPVGGTELRGLGGPVLPTIRPRTGAGPSTPDPKRPRR